MASEPIVTHLATQQSTNMTHATTTKPTVGIFMPFLSNNRGGPDVWAMWLIQALHKPYDVTLITTRNFDLAFFNNFAGTTLSRDDFHVRCLPNIWSPQMVGITAVQSTIYQRSAAHLASEFDLCINGMNLLDLGVPTVHFLADLGWAFRRFRPTDASLMDAQEQSAGSVRRLAHKVISAFARSSGRDLAHEDLLVSCSQWVSTWLRGVGIRSPVIIPPVPFSPVSDEWECKQEDFVWLGRIARSKQLETAINIIAGLRKMGRGYKLHVIGGAVDEQYLRDLKQYAMLSGDFVIFHGPLYGSKKSSLLSKFRYAIHTRANEPFGISMVELIKAGCVVFGPKSAGTEEILQIQALLYESEGDALDTIIELLDDPANLQIVREQLGERAKCYSTDVFCESVRSLCAQRLQCCSGTQSNGEVKH
jgi:glycosyltransferase involved in cell wall biosynthesis